MAKRRGRNSKGPAKDKDKDKDKDPSAQQKKGEDRGKRKARKERKGKEKADVNIDKVAKQLEFYFSDANLRRDRFMKKTLDEGDGAIGLETLLTFNRIKALGVTDAGQLMEAVLCSGMLELTSDDTKVRRDFEKHPIGTYDSVSRTLYIEGLPLTLGVDDLNKFFSEHGKVKLVELPQHRETREPRGFAFVEFGAAQEAEDALKACNGLWPVSWPQRADGKTLRVMRKAEWHQQCRDYKQLQVISSGPSFAGRPKETPVVVEPPDSAGTASGAAPSGEKPELPKPSRRPGCLVRLTGFSGDDELMCTLAIRQFAEHAVTVEYCDYVPSTSTAHLRLKCPEDTSALLEDMKLTGRMLGCHQPTAQVLGTEEEEKYWELVASRMQERGPKEAKQTAKRREPENVVTRIRRWRVVASGHGGPFRAGFTDTAGGSAAFVAAGFGKHRPDKKPKVIPPRKREGEGEAKAARGPRSPRNRSPKKEKVPAVPPPSPYQLPGTTRKRRRGALPPPSPAALPPPSPALDESMSPESETAEPGKPGASSSSRAPEPDLGLNLDEEFDPDEIVSMMEGFA